MSSLNKLAVLLLCNSVLVACTIVPPPKRKLPITAQQLATQELQSSPLSINPLPTGQAIATLPATQPEPLLQINQVGEVPDIATLSPPKPPEEIEIVVPNPNDKVEFDFNQVELKNIIEIIAGQLGITAIIDPSLGDKMVVITPENKPLTNKELWPMLQLLITDAGVTMEKKIGEGREIYYFKRLPPTLPNTIGIERNDLIRSDAPEVLQLTPLRYITVDAAQAVLNPLLQPKGRIISLPNLNIIGIATSPQRLEQVNKLLEVIDADPFLHRGIRLFRLANSKANEVQTELDKLLKALYGNVPPTYQIIALERINSIIVVSPPGSGFADVALWVDVLDEKREESGQQVFIYKVRNLEASKLASTLSNVFKIEDKKAAEEKEKRRQNENQQQPATPQQPGEPPAPAPLPPPPTATGGQLPVSAELNVSIVADEGTNSLLIRATPRDYRHLLETIYLLDRVPKEVMINVVIAEVTLTEATKFGIDWQMFFGGGHGSIGSNFNVPSGNFPIEQAPTAQDAPKLANLTGLVVNYLSGSLNGVLNLIASTNDLKILARPSLLVRNNEEASINVGSNEPFLSGVNTSTNTNQILSNDVQYKDTGITVKVTPRINDDGIINMKIFQELSQLGELRTTQNLQSFIQRKVETSVVVRDGNAIVIGGLIQTVQRDNRQGIPLLKDLPIVGRTLFSSTDKEDTRIELVLIIIPKVVNPEEDNTPLVQNFRLRMKMVSDLLNQQQVLSQ
jgi:general secretion pathway protein D